MWIRALAFFAALLPLAAASSQQQNQPHEDAAVRRNLQWFGNLTLPGYPDDLFPDAPFGSDCEVLEFLIRTQVESQGFDCGGCDTTDENVVITCERDAPACGDNGSAAGEFLCGTEQFTVTAPRDIAQTLLAGGTPAWEVESCSRFNPVDALPDFLGDREFCIVYGLALGPDGFTVSDCGVDFNPILGDKERVCTCGSCEDDGGGAEEDGFQIGLGGFQCEKDLLFNITIEDCIPLQLGSPIVFPDLSLGGGDETDPPAPTATGAPNAEPTAPAPTPDGGAATTAMPTSAADSANHSATVKMIGSAILGVVMLTL